MAKQRGGPSFAAQLLYYPVTDAGMDTGSYHQFAEGYFLAAAGMAWFWDQYLPDTARRREILASPLRATAEELSGLPPAMVINGEADVLRDEGEAYAAKLRAAGVPVTAVRYGGIIHDFVMLHPLAGTHAARAATAQGAAFLHQALHGRPVAHSPSRRSVTMSDQSSTSAPAAVPVTEQVGTGQRFRARPGRVHPRPVAAAVQLGPVGGHVRRGRLCPGQPRLARRPRHGGRGQRATRKSSRTRPSARSPTTTPRSSRPWPASRR